MKLLITNSLGVNDEDIISLKDAGYYDIEFFDTIDESDAEVIVGSIDTSAGSLSNFPQLKYLQILSAGYDNLDTKALSEKKIKMANARGVYSKPIAEYILSYTLSWAKKSHTFYEQQKNSLWQKLPSASLQELTAKTICILGTGSIAQEAAGLFRAFGCHVIGINTSGHSAENFTETVAIADLHNVLAKSDVVVCTLPLSESTYHLFGKEEFLAMKKDALFINIGRGKEVNERELLEILDDHLSQVVLDVFEMEPLPKDSPLWQHPKVIVTPHNSADSDLVAERRKKYVLNNLYRYIKNEDLENQIL